MCGIAGFLGKGNKDNLIEMMATLNNRGPDDEGLYVEGCVHLGHKRLSIIDLSLRGRQPISNEDDSVWLVFNGEIYNFQALRESLISKGHKFKSRTDSEVIVHLYEDYDIEVFEKLNGMFAFALWDKNRRKLYLARDRMGQKPIYYAFLKDDFIFASETKAILKYQFFEKQLNLSSAAKFLFYEHIPTPDSIWENIAQLTPGSYLVYDLDQKRHEIKKYWKLKYLPRIYIDEQEYIDILEQKLIQSIKRHLVANVPVGVYLSGGVDSTTIAYYAQKILNGRLKTFTVAFKEKTFNEQYSARETANLLNTEHYEIDFGASDFIETTFQIVPNMDAPFSDSSFIPAYFLSRFAKKHIKVALGGEGGDEIFVGYPIYRAYELLKYLRMVPAPIRKNIVIPLINNIRTSYNNEPWEYRLKKFVEAEGYLDNPYYCQQIWLGAFGPERLLKLFKKQYHNEIGIDRLFENIDLYRMDADRQESTIDGLMRQTQAKYLMDDGLTKSDRASMLNSLEVRAPLLDNELVEWINRIPFSCKFKRGKTKIILKKLMQGKISGAILNGPKRGFTPPIAKWVVEHFQKEIKECIFSHDNLFNLKYIEQLWHEHFTKKQNHRKLLWTLFVWKLWSAGKL